MREAVIAAVTCLAYGLAALSMPAAAPAQLRAGTAVAPLQLSAHPRSFCTRRVPTVDDDGCPPGGAEQAIDLLVVHHCGVPFAECLGTLRGDHGVSAHYLIAGDGRVLQLVADHHKAYHATYVNPRSIGIELAGSGGADYTDAMYQALSRLLMRLGRSHGVPLVHPETQAAYPFCLAGIAGVVGHYQVQPPGAEGCGYSSAHVKHDPVACTPLITQSECFQWSRALPPSR